MRVRAKLIIGNLSKDVILDPVTIQSNERHSRHAPKPETKHYSILAKILEVTEDTLGAKLIIEGGSTFTVDVKQGIVRGGLIVSSVVA